MRKVTAEPAPADTDFHLHVDCDGIAYDRDVSITVPAGAGSADGPVVNGIPAGTACAVTESAVPNGWQVHDIAPASFVVAAEQTTTVTATNARDISAAPPTARTCGWRYQTAARRPST